MRNPYCQSSRELLRRDNKYCIPERWMYLLNEPYEVSARCCHWLKHLPAYDYYTLHRNVSGLSRTHGPIDWYISQKLLIVKTLPQPTTPT